MDIRQLGKEIIAELKPACYLAEGAGALRRGDDSGTEIDIVVTPKYDPVLLEDDSLPVAKKDMSLFSGAVASLTVRGLLGAELGVNGLIKTFAGPKDSGITVNLWKADETNFGCVLALAIGPESLRKALMRTAGKEGVLPTNMAVIGGTLYRYRTPFEAPIARIARNPGSGVAIPTPDQAALFEAIGVEMVRPSERTDEWTETLVSNRIVRACRQETGVSALQGRGNAVGLRTQDTGHSAMQGRVA
jgi:hypothetical protein